MACCIIAAYLLALLEAKVHRGLVFVGLAGARPFEPDDTIWTGLKARLRSNGRPGYDDGAFAQRS